MTVDLALVSTKLSGSLTPTRLGTVLGSASVSAPFQAGMRGHYLRFGHALSLDDEASAAIATSFEQQGARVRGSAHGPSSALLVWGFHAIAAEVGCELFDTSTDRPVKPQPAAHEARAAQYLETYERDVGGDRAKGAARAAASDEDDDDSAPQAPSQDSAPKSTRGAEFLAWLVREEHLALLGDAAGLAAFLPLENAETAYEQILESEDVDDIFVSESEFRALLKQWLARKRP